MFDFIPNRKFRRKYNKLFKHDPAEANLLLLLCELANEKGQVESNPEELMVIFNARFNDPNKYALKGVS